MQTIDNLPLWVFFLIVLGVALFSTECGYQFGRWRHKKEASEPQAPLATIVASILSLLVFMLAFTFNVALNRFDESRTAVLTEANAIATTYLRADFFADPQKVQIKKLLREYVQARVSGIKQGPDAGEVISKSEGLQKQLWTLAAGLAKEKETPIRALFMSSLNEVIDMHAVRVTLSLHSRVPVSVWLVLFAISIFSMLAIGYYFGVAGNRSWAETVILIASFATVMLLVSDLDRPHQGLIRTNEQPMVDLQRSIGPP